MKKKFISVYCLLLSILLASFFSELAAQSINITNKGREFWVGYGHHQYMETGTNTQNMVIYLSNDNNVPATVTLTIDSSAILSSAWFRKTYTVPANTVLATENMPKGTVDAGPSGTNPAFDARLYTDPPPAGTGGEGIFRRKGIRIESSIPIVAYAHIFGSVSSGATMLIPIESWGYSYKTINSHQADAAGPAYSWMYVVAREDNTTVQIIPGANSRGGRLAGVPFNITLMKGQIYQLIGESTNPANGTGVQLTGTSVKSIPNALGQCKLIAVFAGSSRTGGEIPTCGVSGRDNDMQQCFPIAAWGKRYLTAPMSRANGANLQPSVFQNNVYKVMVNDPTTVVRRNGVVLTGLINNSYYQFLSGTADYITADKPIMIAQFMSNGAACNTGSGDPEMVYLSSIEQSIKQTGFYRNTVEAITSNFVTLIVPTAGVPSLRIDNSNIFDHTYPHPNLAGYTVVVKGWPASKAQCIVRCDSGFVGITYGLGGAESYGYNIGSFLNNLNAVDDFHNMPDTSNINVSHPWGFATQTPMQLGALLAYQPVRIVWRLSSIAAFVTPNADVVQNNPVPVGTVTIGNAVFYRYRLPGTYIFNTPGIYTIPLELTAALGGTDCSAFEIVPIEIDIKPKPTANYTYSQSAGCTITPVCFNNANNTVQGYPIIKRKWYFTSNPADTSNLQNPCFTFPSTGTYPVKLEITTQYGGFADTTINVVVTSGGQPLSPFTAVPTSICAGQQVAFTPTSSVAGTTNWWWDFGSSGAPVNNTTNAAQNITYANPGTYFVKHVIIGSGAGFPCPADTGRATIIVAAVPVIDSARGINPTTCGGSDAQILLYGLTPNATYEVRYTRGTTTTLNLTANAAGIITISALTAGTYSNITAKIGSCTSNAIASVIINNPSAPPVPTAGSNSPICQNNTLNLTAAIPTAPAGVTYAWTGPNGFTSTDQNPVINNAGTAASGTYSVIATANGCSSGAGTVAVVVTANPIIGATNSTNPTNCTSSTGSISLSGLQFSTAYTVSYTSSVSGNQTTNITSNASGVLVITGLPQGTYTNITVSLNNCVSAAVGPFTLTDPTPPAAPTASSNSSICEGQTLNLTASNITNATYSWTGPNSFTSSTQNPSISGASVAASGVYSVTATVNGCTSTPATTNVLIKEIPVVPTVSSNSPICSGNALNLTASSTTAGVSYSWTGANSFSSSVQNPTIASATTAASGTYSVTATLNGCTSAAGTNTVVVNQTPAIASSSSTNPTTCATTTGTIVLNGLQANAAYTVSYTSSAGAQTANLNANASGVVTITGLGAGTYSNVSVSINNCNSNVVGPFTLSDPNPPATPVASSNSPICAGGTLNLTANSTTAGVTYSWTGPNGFTSTQQNPSINNTTTAATGTYSVKATLNGCTSADGTVAVTIKEIPVVPTVSSNSPICSGNALNLTASSTTAGVSYSWTGANSFSSSVQNPTIASATTAASGTYSVTATLNGCTSAAGTTTVVVNQTPAIASSSSTNPTTCATTTGTIVLNGLQANAAYTVNYTSSAGAQTANLNANASGVVTITGLGAGTYSNVSVSINSCNSNVVGPFTLSDPNPPATPVASSNSPICAGGTLNLTANSTTAGVTYSWTGPNGFTSTQQNPSISNITSAQAGLYSVKAFLNACQSAEGSTTIVVRPTPAVSSSSSTNPTACATATGTILLQGLTPATVYTVNYVRNSTPVTINLTANAAGTVTINSLLAGTYSNVTLTNNGCTSAAVGPFTLSDPNPPATPTATSNTPLCNGNTLNLTASSTTAGVSYNWSGPNGFSSTQQNPSINNVIAAATGTYSVTATLNSCTSAAATVAVVVNNTPVISSTNVSNPANCNETSGSIRLNGLLANTSYTVIYTKDGGVPDTSVRTSNAAGQVIIGTLGAGTYTTISVILGICQSNIVGQLILRDPVAPATPVITGTASLCEKTTLTLTATSSTAGVTYAWSGPNGYTAVGQTITIPSTTTAMSGTYSVVATRANCNTGNARLVSVNPVPVVDFTMPSSVCMPGGRATFTNASTIESGTMNYVWSFGNGATSTTASPGYVYPAINNYDVKLVATSNRGCKDSTTKTFSAFFSKPVAGFTVTPDTLCQGVANVFVDTSRAVNSNISNRRWNFGDNNTWTAFTSVNVTKTYTRPGSFVAKLLVTNDQGCVSDTFKKTIKVYLQPKVDAGPSFTVPQGLLIRFNPTVNDSANVRFRWSPPTGLSSADSLRPTLIALNHQAYTLTVTGDGNCTASDSLTVTVLKPLKVPNAFSPNGDNVNDKWVIENLEDYVFATVQVFNRYGQVVYESRGYGVAWDGTYRGKPLPVGVYYYIIDFKNPNYYFPRLTGSLTILR